MICFRKDYTMEERLNIGTIFRRLPVMEKEVVIMSSERIAKGTWVRIHRVVLEPEERTGKLPEDTKKVPLEMWVKGFLKEEAAIGDTVAIETITGRAEEGTLVEAEPVYEHGFGDIYIPELLRIGLQARAIMRDEEYCEGGDR